MSAVRRRRAHGALAELESLAARVRALNPTGRVKNRRDSERLYVEKALLQSEILVRYPDLVRIVSETTSPGVIALAIAPTGESICHAVVERLTMAARDVVHAALEARTSDGHVEQRFAGPPRSSLPAVPSGFDAFERALARFDYDEARCIVLEGLSSGDAHAGWVAKWLELHVEVLGDPLGATSIPIRSEDVVSTDARLSFAKVCLARGAHREALSALRGLESRAEKSLLLALVEAFASEDLGELRRLTASLDGEGKKAHPEVEEKVRALVASRRSQLRRELESRGLDPTCTTCIELAQALAEIDPNDPMAANVLHESHRRHRVRHVGSVLDDVEELLRAARPDAARQLFAEHEQKARRFPELRARCEKLAHEVATATLAEQLTSLIDATGKIDYLRFAQSPARLRARVLATHDDHLSRLLHELCHEVPAETAMVIADAIEAARSETEPARIVEQLGPFRDHFSRAPEAQSLFRASERELSRRAKALLAGAKDGSLPLDELERQVAGLELGTSVSATPEVRLELEAVTRHLQSAREAARVLAATDPTLRLDLFRATSPRARASIRDLVLKEWTIPDHSHANLTGVPCFTVTNGGLLSVVAQDDQLHVSSSSSEGKRTIFRMPRAFDPVRVESRGELVVIVDSRGGVFSFRTKGMLPEGYRETGYDARDARTGPGGLLWIATEGELVRTTLHGKEAARFPMSCVVWGTTGRCACALVDDSRRARVLAVDGSTTAEHPLAHYSLVGIGELPGIGAPIFALRTVDSDTVSMSYRSRDCFVTDWLDDVPPRAEATMWPNHDGTLDVAFHHPTETSVRRYRPLDFGLHETSRAEVGSRVVARTGRGLMAVEAGAHPRFDPLLLD